MSEWLAVYRECGLDESRIDEIMRVLNDTWAEQKLRRIIDNEVLKLAQAIQHNLGIKFNEAMEAHARRLVLERLRTIPTKEL